MKLQSNTEAAETVQTTDSPAVVQERLVMPLRGCHDCRYCGPERPEDMILCNHPSWTHWDEEMRVFLPDFAPNCDSFDAKFYGHNAESIHPESKP